jgi:hypothetical protein
MAEEGFVCSGVFCCIGILIKYYVFPENHHHQIENVKSFGVVKQSECECESCVVGVQ